MVATTYETNLVKRVMKLQEKAINFKDDNAQVSNAFAQSKLLRFENFLHYRNINIVRKLVVPHLTISSFEYKKFINTILEMH